MGAGIASSIATERRMLDAVRAEADVIVDTSDLSLRQLRERLFAQIATTARPDQLAIQILTFGFKYGVPLEADLVFDVRFMQNPYYIPELRDKSGLTPETSVVRARPADHPAVPRVPPRVPRLHRPGLRRRGEDPADDRHRLHRRLPPLDRDRRGPGGVAARARPRTRSPSSTASSTGGEPAALAVARHRGQALAPRRLRRPAAAGPRLRPPPAPAQPGPGAGWRRRHAHRPRDPPVPAVPAARPHRRERRCRPRRRSAAIASCGS